MSKVNRYLKCSGENCVKYKNCLRSDGRNDAVEDYSRNLCNEINDYKWFVANGNEIKKLKEDK